MATKHNNEFKQFEIEDMINREVLPIDVVSGIIKSTPVSRAVQGVIDSISKQLDDKKTP